MIKSVFVRDISHEEYFQIMFLALGFLKKENLEELKLKEVAAAFEKAFAAYDEAFKQARKTGLADIKKSVDATRDNLLIGFYQTLKALLRFPDEATAAAAQRIIDVWDKYGGTDIACKAQGAESSDIANALQDIVEQDLTATGAKRWADKLGEENRRFIELHTRQTEKEALYIAGLLNDGRKALDTEFRRLCKSIDSLAFLNGETAYATLAANINQLVANAQKAVKQKDSARETEKKKKEATPSPLPK